MKLSERLEALLALCECTDDAERDHNAPDSLCVFVDVRPAEFDALLREAAELARRVEWQPIETAPKDGTRVLLRNADNGLYDVGHYEDWSGKTDEDRELLPEWAKDWPGEWCQDNGNGDMTHWRPFDAARAATSGEGMGEAQSA